MHDPPYQMRECDWDSLPGAEPPGSELKGAHAPIKPIVIYTIGHSRAIFVHLRTRVVNFFCQLSFLPTRVAREARNANVCD